MQKELLLLHRTLVQHLTEGKYGKSQAPDPRPLITLLT